MSGTTFTLENPVFRTFLGYAALVLLKTMAMSLITTYHRITKKVFINEEDALLAGKKIHVVTNNPTVERIRRCHLNDLENVIPFVLLGLLYVTTGPALSSAALLFRVFTASRFLHTVVYIFAIPMPSRAVCFLVGFLVNVCMAYTILCKAAF
ncbi:microsomal glutathione S-transferase 1-like [Physella acuta]|uniref:microsomal glutathione S-transferase 1-like n=1 Tax=Physella acuta TaxID=109671 RepID=UPI0027DC25B7|nr:microsomal glutathione S-transferase 1-like [Physella acuta]